MFKKIIISLTILLFSFSTLVIPSNVQAKNDPDYLINDYVKVHSVSKKGETIKIKYTVKKALTYTYTFETKWDVYTSPKTYKTQKLKTKKGEYTATIKNTGTLIGPQNVILKVNVANRYIKTKNIATFYKLPPKTVTSHTMSKKEAVASHIVIDGGITSLKLIKRGKKFTPIGLFLDLSIYGLGSVYILKSLNVIEKGYPTPAAGQYSRTTTSYKKNKIYINIKVWTSKEAYKKGNTPSYDKTQINKWGKVR